MIINKIQESCVHKSFDQLLGISHKNVMFFKTFNSEFTDQNSKPLEIKDKINFNLVIN